MNTKNNLDIIVSLEKSLTLLECIEIVRRCHNKEETIAVIKTELEKSEENTRKLRRCK